MKTLFSVSSLLVSTSIIMSCKPVKSVTEDSTTQAAAGAQGLYHATNYAETFSFSCNGIGRLPSNVFVIATTENSPLLAQKGLRLQCQDKWFPVNWAQPKWDAGHWFRAQKKEDLINNVFKKLPHAFRPSPTRPGEWELNEPDCTTPLRKNPGVCGLPVTVAIDSYTHHGVPKKTDGKAANAVIFDLCPQNHWNNAPKELPSHPDNRGTYRGNPCLKGGQHVDIHKNILDALGVPADGDKMKVKVRLNF